MFSFGENDIFKQVSNPRGSHLREIQVKIQKTIAFAPVLFYGRGVFQYTFGLLPHRKPIYTVGKFFFLCFMLTFGKLMKKIQKANECLTITVNRIALSPDLHKFSLQISQLKTTMSAK